jgi:hypothetical protein
MEDKEYYYFIASNPTAVQSPRRPDTHIWIRRLRDRLARHGVKEQDWESYDEPASRCYDL